jgi:glycine cleavage system H protein
MSEHNLPEELKYTKTHEWVRQECENSNVLVVGITDHAQQLLGDMVFVELPEVGEAVDSGDELGVVESVKAASDFYAPVSGKIIATNDDLQDSPALVNSDPYGDGWLIKIEMSNSEEFDELMSSEDYEDMLTEED